MEISMKWTFQYVTWVVRNFFELPQEGEIFLDSPAFLFRGDSYCLRLYPKMNSRVHNIGYLTTFQVRRLSVNFPEREFRCRIGYRRRERNGEEWDIYDPMSYEEKDSYPRSTIEEDRDVRVPDGNFTVVCYMWPREESGAGSSTQGRNASFATRWSPTSMELTTESPCTRVRLNVPSFFDLSREVVDSLASPEFRFAGDAYRLRFRPNGDTADTDLQLVRLTSTFTYNAVFYRVGYGYREWPRYPKSSRPLVGTTGFCVSRSRLEEERKNYEVDGTLQLMLFLHLGEQSRAGELPGIQKLQSDYRQLLQKRTDSDACVVVRGKEFRVHRAVLRARSTVFEAMFGHDMAEKESGRVVVDDLDPDAFGHFLEYLYSGDVQDKLSADHAFGLYAAADKYDVSTLKSECVERMRRTLSVDSFCDVVTLALRHSEEELLQEAISFLKDNLKLIIITAKWQQFNIDNGASANELLIKALVLGEQ